MPSHHRFFQVSLLLLALPSPVFLAGCSQVTSHAEVRRSEAPGFGNQAGPGDAEERALERALDAFEVVDGRLRIRPGETTEGTTWERSRTGNAVPLDAAELRREAGDHLRAGRLAEAVATLTASLRQEPASADSHLLLARALRQAGRLPLALAAARSGLDPGGGDSPRTTARFLFEAGAIRAAQGPSDEALTLWRQALVLDPSHGESHARLAVSLAQRGAAAEARFHAAAARRLGAPLATSLGPLLEEDGVPVRPLDGATPRVGPPVRVDPGLPGEPTVEPALAATADGELLAAWVEQIDRQGTRLSAARSPDRGATWLPLGPLGPPDPESPALTLNADPDIVFHPPTGRFWMTGTSFSTARLGAIFWAGKEAGAPALEDPADLRSPGSLSDYGMLAAGPGVDGSPSPADTRLYVADLKGLQVSADLGLTWSEVLPYPDGLQLLGSRVEVAPTGEVVVVGLTSGGDYLAVHSLDGGLSFEPPLVVTSRLDPWPPQDTARAPGTFRLPSVGHLAVDPRDATLYLTYFDTARVVETAAGLQSDLDLFLTTSGDFGRTWTAPRPLLTGGDGGGDQFIHQMAVDEAGRLHLVFFDSRREGPQPDSAPEARLDVVYAFSDDRGATWRETFLTAEPFSTAGIAWRSYSGQFLGDYLGLAAAGDHAYPLYPVAAEGDPDLFLRTVDFSVGPTAPCVPAERVLCLGADRRFRVEVEWHDPVSGDRGQGNARPFDRAVDSGSFWFFDPDNLELLVKMLDARTVNGHFWFFHTALSHVGYTLHVTDTRTGESRDYVNPPFAPQGGADTTAF